MDEFQITSSAFRDGETIPSKHSCDEENVSPALHISGVPEGTKSLALIMDDADIPEVVKKARLIDKFDHWILYNIPSTTTDIPEGSAVGVHGTNTYGNQEYAGPCPPPDHEPTTHRYVFQLYALDCELELGDGATEPEVRKAMKGHMLARAELTGVYDRST